MAPHRADIQQCYNLIR